MFGITIAVIIVAWTMFIDGGTMEAGFLSGTSFLWIWYWIWAIFVGTLIVGSKVEDLLGRIEDLLGLVRDRTATLSATTIVTIVVLQGMILGGVYLLMTSGSSEMSFTDFSMEKLIFGKSLLITGLIISSTIVFKK